MNQRHRPPETLGSRLRDEKCMLALHELGRELEFGVRQLETEVAGRSADGVATSQRSELAQHHVVGIVPLEVGL